MAETLKKLKTLRSGGMTYDQIARLVGTGERQIRRWIRGETRMSPAWQIIIDQRLRA